MDNLLDGIYAAAITPYDASGRPDAEQMASCFALMAARGCHGVLVAGTTGEGPSLTAQERITLFKETAQRRGDLRLLAGTGAASLEDAVTITRAAYDVGFDAAVIIPPFFYTNAGEAGLFAFYTEVLRRAVPTDGRVLLYHNPVDCGVGLSPSLIKRLRDAYPQQIIGIKDSSRRLEHSRMLLEEMPGFRVFVGDNRTLAQALQAGGAGSITLLANAFADQDRALYDLHAQQRPLDKAQQRLTATYNQFDGLPRVPAIKILLAAGGIIQNDSVRPPLHQLSDEQLATLKERFLLDRKIPNVIRLSDLADLSDDTQ